MATAIFVRRFRGLFSSDEYSTISSPLRDTGVTDLASDLHRAPPRRTRGNNKALLLRVGNLPSVLCHPSARQKH